MASERSPTDPVNRHAASLSKTVTMEAAIDSHAYRESVRAASSIWRTAYLLPGDRVQRLSADPAPQAAFRGELDASVILRHDTYEEDTVPEYIPSPRQWVRDQVELYERSGGREGTTLRDTGLPVVIVTHTGNKTGAVRKTPLMRVQDGRNYVLVGSVGGAPQHPVWVYNLRANPAIELRDLTVAQPMRVREVTDEAERARLWKLAVAAYPPYEEYQAKTTRRIPLFVAEPTSR